MLRYKYIVCRALIIEHEIIHGKRTGTKHRPADCTDDWHHALRVANQKAAKGFYNFKITEEELVLFPFPLKSEVGKVQRLCKYNQFICCALLTGTERLVKQPL